MSVRDASTAMSSMGVQIWGIGWQLKGVPSQTLCNQILEPPKSTAEEKRVRRQKKEGVGGSRSGGVITTGPITENTTGPITKKTTISQADRAILVPRAVRPGLGPAEQKNGPDLYYEEKKDISRSGWGPDLCSSRSPNAPRVR